MNEQEFQAHLESFKSEQDFLKHLVSLSTGSVLLMVTFLEKLFTKPVAKEMVALSLISFSVSIVSALVIHFLSVLRMDSEPQEKLGKPLLAVGLLGSVGTFGGFLVGIGALVVFALKNL